MFVGRRKKLVDDHCLHPLEAAWHLRDVLILSTIAVYRDLARRETRVLILRVRQFYTDIAKEVKGATAEAGTNQNPMDLPRFDFEHDKIIQGQICTCPSLQIPRTRGSYGEC